MIHPNDHPYAQSGLWKLRWREAWDGVLSRLHQKPQAPQHAITIAEYVGNVFVPEHVALKSMSGRTHYQAMLKHMLTPEEVNRVFRADTGKLKAIPNWPYMDHIRLGDARPEDIQQLIAAALARGYSTQTVTHIRNVARAIFAHAASKQCFLGENPANRVTLPGMRRKEAHALTLAQAKDVLSAMRYPEKEIALIAILTGMNVAEICGLQWKRVNLTGTWSNADGEPIPPNSIAVRKQWYRGQFGDVNARGRTRTLPIPKPLVPVLLGLSRRLQFTGPNDFVLVCPAGTPVNQGHIAERRLKAIGRNLQMPWLSWHVFQRTHKALRYEMGTRLDDGFGAMSVQQWDEPRCAEIACTSELPYPVGTER